MRTPTIDNPRALQLYQLIRFTALFSTGIALAKFSLPRAQIGYYELVVFLTAALTAFWITGLIQALLPLHKNQITSYRNDTALFNTFLVVAGLSILSATVFIAAKPVLHRLTGIDTFPYFRHTALYVLITPPTLLIEYIYLLKHKPRKIIRYGLLTFLLQLCATTLPLLIKPDIGLSIMGLIGISLFRLVWLGVLLYRYSKAKINIKFLQTYIPKAIPLSLMYLISSSGIYIDQALVTGFYGPETFAVYRFGAREIPLILLLANGLSNGMLASFGNPMNLGQSLNELKEHSRKLMHLIFPTAIVGIVLSKPLFPIIFNPDFAESASVFSIYCLISISRSIFPQTVTIGMQHNRAALAVSSAEMVLNIALSLSLIPFMGIEGIALATVIAYTLDKALLMLYNNMTLGINPARYIALKPFTLYSLATILAYLLSRLNVF